MKKNLFKCWGYEKPEIAVIGIEPCSSLLEGSGSGGHNKSGDNGDGLSFYWTSNDRLWVNKATTGEPDLVQDKRNNIEKKLKNNPILGGVQRAAKASFWFVGNFTANEYKVRYTGQNGTKDKVTIAPTQAQTMANDASHIAISGDCGTATAKKMDDGSFAFMLDHQASYATFMPYTSQSVIAAAKIKKIRVSCRDKALCGEFKFTDAGIDTLSRPSATDANRQIELTLSNCPLPSSPTASENAATMVIAPGTYPHFSIEYTLYDAATGVTGTITKTYASVTFTAGKNKAVRHNLQVSDYSSLYYTWDAIKHYWYSYESFQPFDVNDKSGEGKEPRNKQTDSLRWFNDVEGYNGVDPLQVATRSAADCPNVNKAL